jgi:hypothetical protein
MVDWILKRNAKQWAAVAETLQLRAQLNSTRLIGSLKTQFEYNREALVDDIGRTAERVIASFDRRRAAQELTDSVRSSLYQTAILEVQFFASPQSHSRGWRGWSWLLLRRLLL